MSKQNESGRAFEFAVITALVEACRQQVEISLTETSALANAQSAFCNSSIDKQREMQLAAAAGIETVCLLEPRLFAGALIHPLTAFLQEDNAGQKGDPRDVVVQRGDWTLGLSAKHESSWIKSPRLSNLASFGAKWLGVDCTPDYVAAITGAFAVVHSYPGMNWNELPDGVKPAIYKAVLDAFSAELLRLELLHGEIIPQKLMRFLLGNHDYYRLSRLGATTQLQPFNIYGSLAKKAGTRGPITRIEQLPLPTRFLKLEAHSWDRLRMYFDAGWQIEMRVHNKDREIKQSLAFETEIIGQPSGLLTLLMPWGLGLLQ